MIHFLDENVPFPSAALLRPLDRECEVRHLLESMEAGTRDAVWMKRVADWPEKPVVICGDGRILRNPVEKLILRECDLMFVFLEKGWTNLPWFDFAWKLCKAWPAIREKVS